jgi:hypothetical protein
MVRRNARNSDPWTSHEGAEDAPFKLTDRLRVWRVFWDAHPRALADFEMEMLIDGPRNGKHRKRRCDLSADGFLMNSGMTTICPTTRHPQIRWAITPREAVEREKAREAVRRAKERAERRAKAKARRAGKPPPEPRKPGRPKTPSDPRQMDLFDG